jgi:nucleoside-diphosphate-sugar epimerase
MRAVRRGYYVHPKGADALRSFLSVDTAASAIVHLMAHGKAGETYNLADRNPVYLSRWVNDLADCMGVRHPRAVPIALLRAAAFLLTPAAKMGLPVPLTQTSLRKLTAPFSLDTSALASTGFAWPESNADVMNAMVVAAVS